MNRAKSASAYGRLLQRLIGEPKVWLVTGAAGFIGSNLVEQLLKSGQRVVGLDNFSTGKKANLEQVREAMLASAWRRFRMVEGDILDAAVCRKCCRGVDFVLHQAALGSVPKSLDQPLESHASNLTGFVQMLEGARAAGVKRLVYASSSAVYGDDPGLPKRESAVGESLSPYAVTKRADELYAAVWSRCYGLETIGLRYFNVYGRRQDPDGAYAAVIPCWIAAMIRGAEVRIHGDGRTSRDFCAVPNVVQANLLAATTDRRGAANRVYNVALGQRTTLNELYELLRQRLEPLYPRLATARPVHDGFRAGDVRHSLADVSLARRFLGYRPTHDLAGGLDEALEWYLRNLQ